MPTRTLAAQVPVLACNTQGGPLKSIRSTRSPGSNGRTSVRILALLVSAATLSPAQTIFPSPLERFAGRDASRDIGDGPSAYFASFVNATSFTRDTAGNFYIAVGPRIRKIDTSGAVTTWADNLVSVFRLTVTPSSDIVFIGDRGQIQKRSPQGVVSQIAGTGLPTYNGEGVPALSTNMAPAGIALDAAGQIYFADAQQRRVRMIRGDGNVYTVAGTGDTGFAGEGGPAAQAQLLGPFDLAFDAAGNLLIADSRRIVKIDSRGILTRVAGDPTRFPGVDPPSEGPALSAVLSSNVLALDGAGNLYSNAGNYLVKITRDGVLHTIAGVPLSAFTEGCGDASKARLFPQALKTDAAGNLYVLNGADGRRVRLQQITPAGRIVTIAGAGPNLFSGDGGTASQATFDRPSAVAVDAAGRVYVADYGNNRIRRVDVNGTVSTIAGDGGPTYDQDPACMADRDEFLSHPQGIAVDRSGNVYIADSGKNRIRKIAANGAQSTVATEIKGVAVVGIDSSGKLYAGDAANQRVVRVEPDGSLTTVANIAPSGNLAFDNSGRMLIPARTEVDLLLADGRLTRVAGTGEIISETPAEYIPSLSHVETIDGATGVAVDSAGSIYTADSQKRVIQRTTAACAMSNDTGPAVGLPSGIAADSAGNLYFSDSTAQTIWKGTPAAGPAGGPMPRLAVLRPLSSLAASSAGTVAPGELVRVAGACLGPFDPVSASYDVNGKLPTTLGGTRLVIDGVPAPLISVSSGSIVAQVPLELDGIVHVAAPIVQVTHQGVEDRASTSIQDLAPTLFTVGTALLAANQDGSLNTASQPARQGSIIILYGTGFGQTTPPGVTGQAAPLNSLRFVRGPVQVTIGGAPAPVQAALAAPGFVGLTQLNVLVPPFASGAGAIPIELAVRGIAPNQDQLTVWVAR